MESVKRCIFLAGAVVAGWLASSCWSAARPADGLRFPTPDRPVAPIISSAYSSERARDERREAERVLNRLGIRTGLRVADIGAGDGYYTVRLAARLGRTARIYAEDVKAEYLKRLEVRLIREKIRGVILVQGEPSDPKLPPASVDVAILAHMYHEIENPFEFLYRLRPSLAPGARVAIVEGKFDNWLATVTGREKGGGVTVKLLGKNIHVNKLPASSVRPATGFDLERGNPELERA